MRRLFISGVLFSFFCTVSTQLRAQGCSDAGFCSLGPLKNQPPRSDTNYRHSLDIGVNLGLGEEETLTFNPYIQYNWQANSRLSIGAKLTGTYANGFLGHSIAPGDFFAFGTYRISRKTDHQLRLIAGAKLPLTSANSKNEAGKSLPLDYQSSIGTYDLIAGIHYLIRNKIELNTALQAPVIQINRNGFFPDDFSDPRAASFAPGNRFRRKSDILARIGYYLKLNSTWSIKPNLLAIYHIGEDHYEDRSGIKRSIPGSDGLTVNAGVVAVKYFANSTRLELIVAAPFVVRDVRADGLTRQLAFNLQYSFPLH